VASIASVQRRLDAIQRRSEKLFRSYGVRVHPTSEPLSSQPDDATATPSEESGSVGRASELLLQVCR
jgi:hypothetical protein